VNDEGTSGKGGDGSINGDDNDLSKDGGDVAMGCEGGGDAGMN